MIVKSVAFFSAGALAAAKDELIVMSRTRLGGAVTWADLFQPLTTIKALEMGFVVLVAYLVQSPLPKQFIMQKLGAGGAAAGATNPVLPDGIKVESDAPDGEVAAASFGLDASQTVLVIEDE